MPASRRKNTKKSTRGAKNRSARSSKSAKKEVQAEYELPGGFWHQIFAVLMIALSLFFVITWFDHGGSFLNSTHKIILEGIGIATYAIPMILVYLAVKIFRSDNNRIPIPVYIFSLLMLFWISGIGAIWGNGGIVGNWLNNLMLKVLDQGFVIVIYIILIFITLAFIFQLSPLALFRNTKNIAKREKKSQKDDTEDENEKGHLEIKVNSGVPETKAPALKVKKSGFLKRRIREETPEKEDKKPEAKEPTALIAANDPDWKMPNPDLLTKQQAPAEAGNVQQNAMIIKDTFPEFGIDVEMKGANVGPRVTQYTLKAPGGVNLSKIAARDKELAYKLSAKTVRIEAPIPGTQLIGVEVPNLRAEGVSLRGLIESKDWREAKAPLTFAVGKDISGQPVIADLADMRHLLIAGTTGSGKSVMTNTLILSLLYRNSPSDMRLIIVDPKRVEMAVYKDIPHLLTPIINDTTKALSAMKWAAGEMDRRYTIMEEQGVKTIYDYNNLMKEKSKESKKSPAEGEENENAKMPYIVIVIDEMSDLMMQASKELEPLIVRIAQLGRAAGMHLVLATQKPIVKVITGLIKGNIPSRIAFRVLSSMDSRIILDASGADKLLGQGDMLLSSEQTPNGPERIQGAWTPDKDIKKVTDFLRAQRPPQYNEEVIAQVVNIKGGGGGEGGEFSRRYDPNDPLVRKAVEICINNGKFSTSLLQAHLGKGHGYVAGLGYWLESINAIGPVTGTKPRDFLVSSMEEFDELAQ